MLREELAREARLTLGGFDSTEHTTSNIQITLASQSARASTYVHASHYLDDGTDHVPFCMVRNRWDHELIKTGGQRAAARYARSHPACEEDSDR